MNFSAFCFDFFEKRILIKKKHKPLIIIAITRPSQRERALEELGDQLFRVDPSLIIEPCNAEINTALCVYADISPCEYYYNVLRSEPPAFINKVFPLCCHGFYMAVDAVYIAKALSLFSKENKAKVLGLNIVRLYRSKDKLVFIEKRIKRMLKRYGFKIRYRSPIYLHIILLENYFAASILSWKSERTNYWRKIQISK